MGKKKGSSKRWLRQHHNDPYVQQARRLGYRSRAVYKLEQIQRRDNILRPGRTVVDLGAAPGGWSQCAAQAVGDSGRVLALDVLDMEPLTGVEFLKGDFRESEVLAAIEEQLGESRVDLVLSDMAPNLSGIAAADQARAMDLAELALEFAGRQLRGGDMLVKVFQGEGFDAFLADVRGRFRRVTVRKPAASRDASRELYLLGQGHGL
jgi:23S rRNA (uridine2552-2'-O)-methyltransferase